MSDVDGLCNRFPHWNTTIAGFQTMEFIWQVCFRTRRTISSIISAPALSSLLQFFWHLVVACWVVGFWLAGWLVCYLWLENWQEPQAFLHVTSSGVSSCPWILACRLCNILIGLMALWIAGIWCLMLVLLIFVLLIRPSFYRIYRIELRCSLGL